MRTLTRTLSGVLLATSALMASQAAFAQTEPQPAAPAPEEEASEELVVRGRHIPQPMRATSEVAAFLTTEDLQRTGDDDAAAALTRVTGLSVVGGRFVYVRGLGERYSSALLNGSPLPSPEPLQRVVPLDLFPASILAGTTVQKTYSANFPGEFGGGVIDLQTVGVPNDPFLSVSLGVGMDTETTFEPGLTYYGSETDWLGFDDGNRDLPSGLAAAGNRRITAANFSNAEIQSIARSFENSNVNLMQRLDEVMPNGSLDVSAGRKFDLGYGELGVIGVVGYDSSWQTRQGKQQFGSIDAGVLVAQTDQQFLSTQRDVTWNGLLGFGFEAGDHEVRWTNLWVRNTTKEARSREGFAFNQGSVVRQDFTEWFERELLNTQLAGSHVFGALEIDWRASYAETTREAPYESGVTYGSRLIGGAPTFTHNPSSDDNYVRFGTVDDSAVGAGVDLTYDVPTDLLRDAKLRAGYAYTQNDRDSQIRRFRFRSDPASGTLIQTQRIDYIRSDYNISNGLIFLEEVTGQEGADAYTGSLTVHGAYAQIDAEVIPLVRASVGVRFEQGEQDVGTVNFLNDPFFRNVSTSIEEEYVLPSATLTWNFAEDQQIRLGASKTIARPQFRELAPQQYLDPETDRTLIGNPFLVNTELTNFDARYEWYFERRQYFTVGAFYKQIDKPVEASIYEQQTAALQQTFINAPKALLYGFEVEGKKYFDAKLGHDWIDQKRWLIQANYTYGKSEVQVEPGDVVYPTVNDGAPAPASFYVVDGSRLQGQSEHLANLQFGFEDEQARSQATFLVNYASERITVRGNQSAANPTGQPDVVQDPGVTLDFVYRKDFEALGNDLSFSFEARNLTGEDFEEYQEFGGGRVDLNSYDLGRTFSVSLTAKF